MRHFTPQRPGGLLALALATMGLVALAHCAKGGSSDDQGGTAGEGGAPGKAGNDGTGETGGNGGEGSEGGSAGASTAGAGGGGGTNAGGMNTGGSSTGGTSAGGSGGMNTGGNAMNTGGTPVMCNGLPKLKLTKITNATSPLSVQQPAGDDKLYILERQSRIRTFAGGQLKTFFQLPKPAPTNSERGLLGMAFHPQYKDNGRFFVYYTAPSADPSAPNTDQGDLIIAEGKRSAADPTVAESTLKVLSTAPHSQEGNHNGGMIAFGPDGMLYAGTGDGGGGGDPFKTGQNATSRLGKMLRIDVDNPTSRPQGNMPAPADIHVWGVGLRNPWRWSFDRMTGDLYIGDVGQNDWEEVSVVPKDTPAGVNFGWSVMEGKHCFGSNNCDMNGKVMPAVEYVNPPGFDGGNARTVIGGYVYRGAKLPCLQGRYLYAEHYLNKVYSFVWKNGQATDEVELTNDLVTAQTPLRGVVAFGEDNAGELYVMDLAEGNVYRIDPE